MIQKERDDMNTDSKEISREELDKFIVRYNKTKENYKKYNKAYRERQNMYKQMCIDKGLIVKK